MCVQAPLQPLQDNLESQTYETFERDANKYLAYEEAVVAALLDRVPDPTAATGPTVLMVVGAGRGPLVRASLRAAERTGRKLRVFAVEKNPHAVVTLQNLIVSEGCVRESHATLQVLNTCTLALCSIVRSSAHETQHQRTADVNMFLN